MPYDRFMQLSYRVGRPVIDPNQPSEALVLAEIQAPIEDRPSRPPVHFALVLDRSGSMNGEKLAIAKDAVRRVLAQLQPDDRISLVAFDSEVEVIAAAVDGSDKALLHARVSSLVTGGNTNLSGGWLAASEILLREQGGQPSRIVMLTDGRANEGVTNPDDLAGMTRGLADRGIATSTVGVGRDYSEQLLDAMASSGNGNFYHLDAIDTAAKAFLAEFGELAQLFAQNVRLRISPAPNVELAAVLHEYPCDADAAGLTVRLGDLHCGELRPVLCRFACRPGSGEAEITAFTLRYHQVAGGVAVKEVSTFVKLAYALVDPSEPLDPIVATNLAICAANNARTRAAEALRRGDNDAACSALGEAMPSLMQLGLHDEARALEATVASIHEDAAMSSKRLHMHRSSSTPEQTDAEEAAARGWYGYGRWSSPYWFIGPEPGMKKAEGDNARGAYRRVAGARTR